MNKHNPHARSFGRFPTLMTNKRRTELHILKVWISSPLLQFLLEVSQKDPRVLSGREQTPPLQSIPPGCDLDTFCCEYHDYKVHESGNWLADLLFFCHFVIFCHLPHNCLASWQELILQAEKCFSILPMLHIFISFTWTVWFGTWQQNSIKLSLIPQNLRSSA